MTSLNNVIFIHKETSKRKLLQKYVSFHVFKIPQINYITSYFSIPGYNIYIYIYIYACVYVCVCVHICMCTYMYVSNVYMYVHTYVCVCTYTRTCTHIHITHTHKHTYIHTYMYTYIYNVFLFSNKIAQLVFQILFHSVPIIHIFMYLLRIRNMFFR